VKKKSKKKMITLFAVIFALPVSAVAFFSIGPGDGTLLTILETMRQQLVIFTDISDGVDGLQRQMSRVGDNIHDLADIDLSDIIDNDIDKYEDIFKTVDEIPEDFINIDDVMINITDNMETFSGTASSIVNESGINTSGDNMNTLFDSRSVIPHFALKKMDVINKESDYFSDRSLELVKTLKDDEVGLATIHGAKANALQVHLLSRVTKNQSVQMGMQAQQVLYNNETRQQMYDLSKLFKNSVKESIDRHAKR